ncbi:MAG: FecR domain-containing protein [Leadbetterella sp.]|nr:FecR domain-containing protein [Leadbetterella sp.]
MVDRWYDAADQTRRPAWMNGRHIRKAKQEVWQKVVVNLGIVNPEGAADTAPMIKQWKPLVRYAAAAVVIGFGLWGLWYSRASFLPAKEPVAQRVETYTSDRATRKYVKLMDGTEVWLNNETAVRVKAVSERDSVREVWLLDGEAYFKVAKDAHKPFIVHVDGLQARVLGTEFNITAYRKLPKWQITVTEGAVQIGHSGKALDTLTRNMQLAYRAETGDFVTLQKEFQPQYEWWNDRFVLDNATFDELALRFGDAV